MNEVNEHNASEVAKTVRGGALCGPSTVRRSPSITALASAMVKVQSEIEDPTKNRQADRGRGGTYRYADLPTVLDSVRPVLVKHGLTVMQFPCELGESPALTTLLVHCSGDWLETTMRIRPGDSSPQSVGSALTYARRYALLSLCGVAADDDDDGKAASQPSRRQQPEHAPEPVDVKAVARFVGLFAKVTDEAGYKSVCEQIAAGVQAGGINAATRQALREPAQSTLARLQQPAKA